MKSFESQSLIMANLSLFQKLKKDTRAIRCNLLAWYHANARDLPWRKTSDPYCIWLSEIMLQQTKTETVIPYYENFLRAFPVISALAEADEDRVLKLWEGLGYYRRAHNLCRAAKMIVGTKGGQFPKSAKEWMKLPGVGRYTACAIASIAFGEKVAVLDGNVKRVLSRIFRVKGNINEQATLRKLWMITESLVAQKSPGDFNQAIMELGARICKPKDPRCDTCPVKRQCGAFQIGRQTSFPVMKRKREIPHYHVVAAVIRRNGRYLICKRPVDGMLGGLWEFPGGKVEKAESYEQALIRELKEELGIRIKVGERITTVKHAYSHFSVSLHAYRCDLARGKIKKYYHSEIKWIPRSHFSHYAFPGANHKVLNKV